MENHSFPAVSGGYSACVSPVEVMSVSPGDWFSPTGVITTGRAALMPGNKLPVDVRERICETGVLASNDIGEQIAALFS